MNWTRPRQIAAWIGGGAVLFLAAVFLLQTVYGGGSVVPSPEPVPLVGSALLHYPFNGSLAETSGFGREANGTALSYVQGVDGQAIAFDGANSTVRVPGTSTLDLSSPFRVEAWVMAREDAGKGYIVSRHNYTARRGYTLFRTADGRFGFRVGNGTAWTGIYSEAVPAGEWYHVAGILDGGRLHLAIDGTPLNYTQPFVGELVNEPGPLFVGRPSSYAGDLFAGRIDEVRIASDTVAALFPFDGTVTDRSGHGYAVDGDAVFVAGQDGQALHLDGNTTLTVDPRIGVDDAFTVEAWIRPEAADHKQHIVSTYRYGPATGYLLAVTADRKVEFRVGNGTDGAGLYSAALADDGWHHVAGVFDGERLSLYVDGEDVGYHGTVDGIAMPDTRTVIGGTPGYVGDRYTGDIDALRVSRTVLRPDAFHLP